MLKAHLDTKVTHQCPRFASTVSDNYKYSLDLAKTASCLAGQLQHVSYKMSATRCQLQHVLPVSYNGTKKRDPGKKLFKKA